MIEYISLKFAQHIKNNDDNADIEVLNYSLLIILNTLLVVISSLMIGLIIGRIESIILVMVSFAILRIVTGGHHIKSSLLCAILSVSMLVIISFISMNNYFIILCNIASIILVLIYAPFNILDKTNIKPKYFIHLKIIGMIIVLSNFIWMSDVIACAFFVQSLLLINSMRGGER